MDRGLPYGLPARGDEGDAGDGGDGGKILAFVTSITYITMASGYSGNTNPRCLTRRVHAVTRCRS
jgi:hypothetical protein